MYKFKFLSTLFIIISRLGYLVSAFEFVINTIFPPVGSELSLSFVLRNKINPSESAF
jgi:hypothetical protein